MKKANDFQIAQVHFQGAVSLLLNFFASFSLVLLNYKSVAYKNKGCSSCCRLLLNYNTCKK